MLIYKGKYNVAKVMLEDYNMIDNETVKQIHTFLNHPAFKGQPIIIMPDTHAGKGSVIGFTMKMNGYVIPNIVGVDIGCLDKETEYLTKNGWKKINSFKKGEKILQYNKDNDTAEFVHPSNYIIKPCTEFYHFKNSKGLDQMLSEEHKMLIWAGFKSRGYNLIDMNPIKILNKELSHGFYGIKTSFNIKQKGINFSDNEIKLLIATSADGTIRMQKANEQKIEFHLKKERKIKRLKEILSNLHISYKEYFGKNNDRYISFYCPNKFSKNLSILWKANQHQLNIVAKECLKWDGHEGYRSFYSTTIKENADIIQFVFAAINIRAGIYVLDKKNNKKAKKNSYNVIPTKNNIIGITNVTKEKAIDNKKYCFTVPSGYFIIRRNNKISITGNCGMLTAQLTKESINFEKLDQFVRHNIPAGHRINQQPNKYLNQITPQKYIEEFKNLSHKTGQKVDPINSLGTLGGGNHFIEIGKDSKGDYWLTIHSGSRNFGLSVCNYHQNKAKKLMNTMFIGDAYKDLEFLPMNNGGEDYLQDMDIAQKYAYYNRLLMMKIILKDYFDHEPEIIFECVHNYINMNDKIIRKGAISAYPGEKVLIPLNMRDGVIYGEGKGNPEWNYSAPHGAGRVLSRKKAKEQLDLEIVKESMKGIWTSSLSENTKDEAPQAYKDSEMIKNAIQDTVQIIDF